MDEESIPESALSSILRSMFWPNMEVGTGWKGVLKIAIRWRRRTVHFDVVESWALEEGTFNGGHSFANGDGGEVGTAKESLGGNRREAAADGGTGEAGAELKGLATHGCDAVGNDNVGEAGTLIESRFSYGGHVFAPRDTDEVNAAVKGIIPDGRDTVGNDDVVEDVTSGKHIVPDGGHPIGDVDGGKAGAPQEGVVSDGDESLTERNVVEGPTVHESSIANSGEVVGEVDAGEKGAISEGLESDNVDRAAFDRGRKIWLMCLLPGTKSNESVMGFVDCVDVRNSEIVARVMITFRPTGEFSFKEEHHQDQEAGDIKQERACLEKSRKVVLVFLRVLHGNRKTDFQKLT